MSGSALFFLVLGLALIGWLTARARAVRLGGATRLHSLPGQHGWYVAMWVAIPAFVFLTVWSSIGPQLAREGVLASPQAASLPAFAFERSAILAEARAIARDPDLGAFNPRPKRLRRSIAPTSHAMPGSARGSRCCSPLQAGSMRSAASPRRSARAAMSSGG